MKYKETMKKSKPESKSNPKTQESEVKASYPSRYKNEGTENKTMKKINDTYSSRY